MNSKLDVSFVIRFLTPPVLVAPAALPATALGTWFFCRPVLERGVEVNVHCFDARVDVWLHACALILLLYVCAQLQTRAMSTDGR